MCWNVEKQRTGGCSLRCDVNLDLSTPDSWHRIDVGICYILLLDRSLLSLWLLINLHTNRHTHLHTCTYAHTHTCRHTASFVPVSCLGSVTELDLHRVNVSRSPTTLMEMICVMCYRSGNEIHRESYKWAKKKDSWLVTCFWQLESVGRFFSSPNSKKKRSRHRFFGVRRVTGDKQ